MKKQYKRFKDLVFKKRQLGSGVQAVMQFPNGHAISVVGGIKGLYGDGVKTFEIWKSTEQDPRPYLTPEEIDLAMIELQSLPPINDSPGFRI